MTRAIIIFAVAQSIGNVSGSLRQTEWSEFIDARETAANFGELLSCEKKFFGRRSNYEIHELTNEKDPWIATRAQWEITKRGLLRAYPNRVRQKLEMEYFLGFLNGRFETPIPERFVNHFRNVKFGEDGSFAFEQRANPQEGVKEIVKFKVDKKFVINADTAMLDGQIGCFDKTSDNRLWKTALWRTIPKGIALTGLHPEVLSVDVTFDRANQFLYLWGVNTNASYIWKLDAKTGKRLSFLYLDCGGRF